MFFLLLLSSNIILKRRKKNKVIGIASVLCTILDYPSMITSIEIHQRNFRNFQINLCFCLFSCSLHSMTFYCPHINGRELFWDNNEKHVSSLSLSAWSMILHDWLLFIMLFFLGKKIRFSKDFVMMIKISNEKRVKLNFSLKSEWVENVKVSQGVTRKRSTADSSWLFIHDN